jgi:redox-sensitive bicupin YhaK (pirin superfamily)
MITIRRSEDRGHANHGWLDSFHTFSFADYHDPAHMGFRALRVINEDRVQPSRGFGTHSHRDMEIVTYIIAGALEHRDSMDNGSVIRPGDLQLMRAGTGVTHSEFNHSDSAAVHLLQIWIQPDRAGLAPAYEEKHFPAEQRRDVLRLVVSPDGREGSLPIHQDAEIRAGILGAGAVVEHALKPGRHAWIQMVEGAADVNGVRLEAGDGAAVSDETALRIASTHGCELLLFDLA